MYPGLAPFSSALYGNGMASCSCRGPRFDLDRYGRLALPNAFSNSVTVMDNAGNVIRAFGKYGNFDSQYVPPGATDAKPLIGTPDIPLAWPVGAGFTEKAIYVADNYNRRVVRADMTWQAEEICAPEVTGTKELSMNPFCKPAEHRGRRAFLKGTLTTASGLAVANWGGLFNSQTIAAEVRKQGKHCILLWMAGGASHMDTFDMKPGRPQQGPFRPIATRVPGIQVCEYLPKIAQQADKLAIIRSMKTAQGDHPGATFLMHTGYRKEQTVQHPEIGAMIAKYLGAPGSDLPHFIQVGAGGGESSPAFGPGYLGPAYQPFHLSGDAAMPAHTVPYVAADAQRRRNDLLRFVDEGFARQQQDAGPRALCCARKSGALARGESRVRHQGGVAALPRPLRRHGLRQELPDGPASDRGRRRFRGGRAGQLRFPYR